MNKNIIAFLLLAFIAYHVYGVISRDNMVIPQIPVVEITHDEILNSIQTKDVKQYVEALASREFDGRGTGTEGNIKAAKYIKNHLDKLKIPYKEQEFSANGRSTKNIIGYIIPKHLRTDDILVVGAHFDHLGSRGGTYYPGADDNASGVAGLMGIATALSKYKDKLNHTVLLQFYSGEELGLLGSKYYTNNPMFPEVRPDIKKHIAMINLDMIGYLRRSYSEKENVTRYRDCDSYIIHGEEYPEIDLKSIVGELSTKYPFAKNISGYKPGGSDHAPFYNKGIPVVFLHTGTHPYYHKPSDTPEKLNYDGLVSVSKLALEILIQADKK